MRRVRPIDRAVTVLSVLEEPVVSRGGPEILAGRENVLRRVRWVHISDQPDIAAYLRGGEVLLTSGTGLPHGAEALRRYVASLAEAGVAALVVRAEMGVDAVPMAMVTEAAKHGLPLVRLNHRIGFVEVTRALHERLLDAEMESLRRTDELRSDLMRILVESRPLGSLVERIAEALDRAVLVEDTSGRIVSMRWPGHHEDELLELWNRRSHTFAQPLERSSVHAAPGVAWSGLRARGVQRGRLLALDYGPVIEEHEAGLLEVGAAVLNLAMVRDADAALMVERAGDQFVADLVAARTLPVQRLRRRAAALGVELGEGMVIGLALRRRGGPVHDLRRRVERLLRPWATGALLGLYEGHLLALVQVLEPSRADQHVRVIVEELNRELSGGWSMSRPAVVGGTSTRQSPAEGGLALLEALSAAEHAAAAPRGETVHRFEDLGLHRLLRHLADEGRLASYVKAQLGPLLERDRAGRSPLVETLRAYLAHNCRATETAQVLFIERRTLYHRLRTLGELLGEDLDDDEARIRIGVALEGLDILDSTL